MADSDILNYSDMNHFLSAGFHQHGWGRWVHFGTQASFLCDAELKSMIDFVGRHEDFSNDCRILASRTGADFVPRAANKTACKNIGLQDLSLESLDILTHVISTIA